MNSKIENPVVLIHKRDNSDSYAVAITSGSQNYHDALLMATMEPDMVGDAVDTWSKTGYYMAEEIERWRRVAALVIARLDSADDKDVWQVIGFALGALECAFAGGIAGAAQTCRSSEKEQVVQEQSGPLPTEDPVQSGDSPGSVPVNGITAGKPLTITHMPELVNLIKSANADPSAMTDAIWEAGYRQPERTAEEAAQITIDTFFYCESFSMPSSFWPENYDSVLKNELMKAVIGEDGELDGADATTIAQSVITAGFSKEDI